MDDDLIPDSLLHAARAILVVDDTRALRRLTARLLSEEGYRVFEASDAIEALEVLALARGRVDVVLIDVVMPDVTGVDLARLIQEQWPDARCIFMSGQPAQVLVQEGARDLSVPFLAKPFTRDELVASVQRVRESGRQARGEGRGARRPPKDS
jgi:two-component system, cell cycle sensor histidine kinase and response regulator CckA